jgi:hypothetical protein
MRYKKIKMKKQKDYIDLYTDYLISVRGEATATGLSDMSEWAIIERDNKKIEKTLYISNS